MACSAGVVAACSAASFVASAVKDDARPCASAGVAARALNVIDTLKLSTRSPRVGGAGGESVSCSTRREWDKIDAYEELGDVAP